MVYQTLRLKKDDRMYHSIIDEEWRIYDSMYLYDSKIGRYLIHPHQIRATVMERLQLYFLYIYIYIYIYTPRVLLLQ